MKNNDDNFGKNNSNSEIKIIFMRIYKMNI